LARNFCAEQRVWGSSAGPHRCGKKVPLLERDWIGFVIKALAVGRCN
jgi:hypothetical protein